MKRHLLLVAILAAVFSLSLPSEAAAQANLWTGGVGYNSPNGPTVSPYLNLLQNSADPTQVTNYQSLVRPLIGQNTAIRRQGGAIQQLQQQSRGGGYGGGTGIHSYFMYYSHFFPPPGR